MLRSLSVRLTLVLALLFVLLGVAFMLHAWMENDSGQDPKP